MSDDLDDADRFIAMRTQAAIDRVKNWEQAPPWAVLLVREIERLEQENEQLWDGR